MVEKIPSEMKAIVRSSDPKKVVEVSNIPVPKPGKGEVLIRVEACPINPSDEYFAAGIYGLKEKLNLKPPVVPGFEGSGVVVGLGESVPSELMNQRVAFVTDPHDKEKWSGTWAQYLCVDHQVCVPIGDASFEETCGLFVNPLTVMGFLLETKKLNSKGIVHTAAASSLGKMLLKMCIKNNLELINIIRREEQAETLKKLGAKHVLNQNDPKFVEELSELTNKLGITVCFDAVSGPLVGKLLAGMPMNSTVYVYGALDYNPISGVSQHDLLFKGKKLHGFWISTTDIFKPEELQKALKTIIEDIKSGSDIFKPKIVKKLKLEECSNHLTEHGKHPTEGKTIILPNT
jgi:NADPH:quinone reductase-like Zn-dependent oxidoreductase